MLSSAQSKLRGLMKEGARFSSFLGCPLLGKRILFVTCLVWGPCWIVLGCCTTLVLEMPVCGLGWIVLGCSTTLDFSTGNASFRVLAGLCLGVQL